MAVDADGSTSRGVLSKLLTEECYQSRCSKDWSRFGRMVDSVSAVSLMVRIVVSTPEEILNEKEGMG